MRQAQSEFLRAYWSRSGLRLGSDVRADGHHRAELRRTLRILHLADERIVEEKLKADQARIASVVNPAINDLLAQGPAPDLVRDWSAKIAQCLREVAMSPTEAAHAVAREQQAMFEKIQAVRGIPVKSIMGEDDDDGALTSAESYSEDDFKQLHPFLVAALAKCTADLYESANSFRSAEINEALDSFSEWAAELPQGGSKSKEYRDSARSFRGNAKATCRWQNRFFTSHVGDIYIYAEHIFARHNGAIAATWHWEGDLCHKHKEKNGECFLLRGSWAINKGFLATSSARYDDEVELPGIGCRCRYTYIHALRSMPPNLLSKAELTASDSAGHKMPENAAQNPQSAGGKSLWTRLFSRS